MSLLDTLHPSSPPPTPKNARSVRPLDRPGDEREEDEPPVPAACGPIDYKALAMNNKAASLRTLLRDHPDGLGFDELSRYTGIARDRIGAHVASLLSNGDAKAFEIPGRGRIFKFAGDPKRVGPRFPDQIPTVTHKAAATTQPASSRDDAARAAPSTAAEPKNAETSTPTPATGSSSASAASPTEAPQGSTRPIPDDVAAPSARAPASVPVLDPAKWLKDEPADRPPAASEDSALALAIDLALVAANNLAAAIRDCVEFGEDDAVGMALANFERADRLYVSAKGTRA